MASLTTNNNAMEMQYKPAEPMQASPSITAAHEIPYFTQLPQPPRVALVRRAEREGVVTGD
ncbi:hypothetical protein LTR12_009705 [Friedmanniomyces endolithicus]|nr:hypothetical protein LTR12_009705 [Friedmanniomyces endolithicus]